jgi:hypothetical protein
MTVQAGDDQCSVCGRIDVWPEDWQWYGSINDMELGKIVVTCSQACRDSPRTQTLIDNMTWVNPRQRPY